MKMKSFCSKNLAIFQDVKKKKKKKKKWSFILLMTRLFLIFANQESFSERICRDGIKNIFHNI